MKKRAARGQEVGHDLAPSARMSGSQPSTPRDV